MKQVGGAIFCPLAEPAKSNKGRLILPDIQTATPEDIDRVLSTVMLAFAADPMHRWGFPNGDDFVRKQPNIVRVVIEKAFTHDSAYVTSDFTGMALWLPPAVHPDGEAFSAALEANLDEPLRSEVGALFEEMGKWHPTEPHWLLHMIVVDPAHRGKGIGSALLRHSLERCDREGALAALDATSPRNAALYERVGFEHQHEIQVGSSPTIYSMIRRPQS